MAERNDFDVNYEVSPRLVSLTSASEEITVQDSHDTLTREQDTPEGQQFPELVSTTGGEPLGGGTSVGLTTVLNNVQYAFQSTPVISSGTATSASSTQLIDTAATFQTDGVKRGDWIINFTDQSVTEVLTVVSETVLDITGLREGTGNDFGVSDAYKIWQVEEAELSGGNFTAIDDVGGDINPLFPVFGRFATKTASSSATTQSQAQLEYTTYNNGVWLDVANGIALNGADPLASLIGNAQFPVNNIPDLNLIQQARGLPRLIYLLGNLTLDTGDDITNFKIIGENAVRSFVTINDGAITTSAEINEAYITGNLDGGTIIRNSVIDTLNYINGFVYQSMIANSTISLGGVVSANFFSCYSGVPGTGTPTIDMNGAGAESTPLAIRDYNGGIRLIDLTGGASVSIDLVAGQVKIDPSCTSGTVVVRGNGKVINAVTGDNMPSGTYFGGLTLMNESAFGVQVQELWQVHGLDEDNPLAVTPTSRTAGNISQTISGDGVTNTGIQRN